MHIQKKKNRLKVQKNSTKNQIKIKTQKKKKKKKKKIIIKRTKKIFFFGQKY